MTRTDVSRPTSPAPAGLTPRSDGALALAGAATFAGLIIVLHAVEDEFQPCCRFISEYVLGGWGWLMNLAFLAMGGAFLAVAHGLRRSLAPGRRVTASVRLLYVTSVTAFMSGLFDTDSLADTDAGRYSWHGTIHELSSFLGILLVVLTLFFLRGVFAKDPQWRRFAPHMVMFAVACIVSFALVMFGPSDSFGLAQRVFVTVDVLCIGTLGCALLGAQPAR